MIYRRTPPRWTIEPRKVVEPLDQARKLKVRERDGDICAYCGIQCVEGGDRHSRPEVDHIIARKDRRERGTNRLENLTVACNGCNSSKGNIPVLKWLRGRELTSEDVRRIELRIGHIVDVNL